MQKIIHFLKNFFSYKEVATGNWNRRETGQFALCSSEIAGS